jgi:hypothetical protein
MSTMPRPALPLLPFVLTALVASLAMGPYARAQTEPPPGGAAPAPTQGVPAPAPAPAPPSAATLPGSAPAAPGPGTPAPAPAAGLPAAPPPAAPAATPALATVEPGALPALPPEEQAPFYKQTWFWAVIGVVALTSIMVSIGVSAQGPKTPNTDLGNMRAY